MLQNNPRALLLAVDAWHHTLSVGVSNVGVGSGFMDICRRSRAMSCTVDAIDQFKKLQQRDETIDKLKQNSCTTSLYLMNICFGVASYISPVCLILLMGQEYSGQWNTRCRGHWIETFGLTSRLSEILYATPNGVLAFFSLSHFLSCTPLTLDRPAGLLPDGQASAALKGSDGVRSRQ